MKTNKKQKYYVRIEYTLFNSLWIDEFIINTDDKEKIYNMFHKNHGESLKDIRVFPLSEFKTMEL